MIPGEPARDALGRADARALPSALERREEIAARLDSRRPAVFLDYDGTLTPIVNRPEDAFLPERTRQAVRRLAQRCPVGILSGRDLRDLRGMVDLEGIVYAGSHGYEIDAVGRRGELRQGMEFLDSLDEAEREAGAAVAAIPGARLERKRFSVAVHWREVVEARGAEVERAVRAVLSRHPDLRMGSGKRVFEIQPRLDWDKGRALEWVLEALGLEGADVLPIYLGDDRTDEDAFRVLRGRGLSVLVRDEARPTWADYALEGPSEVAEMLAIFEGLLGSGGRPVGLPA
jgi:trehalose-phosphatase